jgi:hypothetical protein
MNINYFFEMILNAYFFTFKKGKGSNDHDKWAPVTTAWRVLRLRMEERLLIWMVATNILNKKSRTADKGWYSSLGVGRGAKSSIP